LQIPVDHRPGFDGLADGWIGVKPDLTDCLEQSKIILSKLLLQGFIKLVKK
jgi:hypothetical protein